MPTRRLPPAPHLGHLRSEAKLLQRRVRSADPDAIAMVRELHPRLALIDIDAGARDLAQFTRADAQLVVARQYGFASWTRLRRHVDVVVRPIDSLAELARVFDVVGAQSVPPITRTDRRYADQERRFPDDRPMMLLAADRGQVVGGGFAFRRDSSPSCSAATLRNVAVQPAYQGLGLERRLVEGIERGATSLGVTTIDLGGPRGAERAFYLSMGYHGRHEGGLMGKHLARPACGRTPTGGTAASMNCARCVPGARPRSHPSNHSSDRHEPNARLVGRPGSAGQPIDEHANTRNPFFITLRNANGMAVLDPRPAVICRRPADRAPPAGQPPAVFP